MKKIFICLLASMALLFSACGKEEVVTAYPNVNEVEGVSLSIMTDTLKKTEATFLLINDSPEPVEYATSEYHLEEAKDDNWKEFTGTAQSDWAKETTTLAAGESVELFINWKTFCGPIAKDTLHRMIIPVNDSPVAVEFQVN